MTELKHRLLELIQPNEVHLLSRIRTNVDDSMFREIAREDYGTREEEYYVFMREIVEYGGYVSAVTHLSNEDERNQFTELIDDWSTSDISSASVMYEKMLLLPKFLKISFLVKEVLDLSCYGPYDDVVKARESWRQLFVCWTYLQMRFACFDKSLMAADKLSVFVTAAVELGEPVSRMSVSFLASLFNSIPDREDHGESERDIALLAFAIVLLSAHTERSAAMGEWLKAIVDWFESVDVQAKKWQQNFGGRGESSEAVIESANDLRLIICYLPSYNVDHWLALTRAILLPPEDLHPPEADRPLRRLGGLFESGVRSIPSLTDGLFDPGSPKANEVNLERAYNRIVNAVKRAVAAQELGSN